MRRRISRNHPTEFALVDFRSRSFYAPAHKGKHHVLPTTTTKRSSGRGYVHLYPSWPDTSLAPMIYAPAHKGVKAYDYARTVGMSSHDVVYSGDFLSCFIPHRLGAEPTRALPILMAPMPHRSLTASMADMVLITKVPHRPPHHRFVGISLNRPEGYA